MTARLQADCLLRNATLVTLDEDLRVIEPGAVAVIAGRIVDLGQDDWIAQRFHSSQEIDCSQGYVLPGLVNLHGHASLCLFRGREEPTPNAKNPTALGSQSAPPAQAHVALELLEMDLSAALVGFELAAAEMIRSGITTFVDMFHYQEAFGPLVERVGLRAVLGEMASEFLLHAHKRGEDQTLKSLERHLSRYEGHPRIQPAVAPHGVHTASKGLIKRVAGLAREARVPLLIHAAESEYEMNFVRQLEQMRPIRLLDEIGALSEHTIAAQAVYLDREDMARLAHRGATVAYCPQSTAARGRNPCPIGELASAGVRVAFGTDDVIAQGSLDILSEMKFASILEGPKGALRPSDYLAMSTTKAASALGREELGCLRVNSPADLIVIETQCATMAGAEDPYQALVMRAGRSEVRDVMVEGQWLMRDRVLQTIDEDDVLQRARRARESMASSTEHQGLLLRP